MRRSFLDVYDNFNMAKECAERAYIAGMEHFLSLAKKHAVEFPEMRANVNNEIRRIELSGYRRGIRIKLHQARMYSEERKYDLAESALGMAERYVSRIKDDELKERVATCREDLRRRRSG